MNEEISFNESISNMEYPDSISYLLNFWYTTKINKEHDFIKRNGIHPYVFVKLNEYRGCNELEVAEGNSIQTNFYTVFRIFIENLFNKNIKVSKERNSEKWNISFKEDAKGLDIPEYLLLYYAKKNNIRNEVIDFPAYRYRQSGSELISIKLRKRDQLHAKKVLDCMDDFLINATIDIEEKIKYEADNLLDNISFNMHLDFSNKIEKKENLEIKSASVSLINSSLHELLPIYRAINSSISGLDSRARFSFILNYAQQGANSVINSIENSEQNYLEFMVLTDNMAA
jgi:hypothetical protein